MESLADSPKAAKVTRFVKDLEVQPPPTMILEETGECELGAAVAQPRRPSIFGAGASEVSAAQSSQPKRFVEEISDSKRSQKSPSSQVWTRSHTPSSLLTRAAVATRTIAGMLHQRPKTVFDHPEELKKRVDRAIHEGDEVYDVESLYWDTGFSQRLARSVSFQNTTLAAILLYAAWLAYDADTNNATTLVKAEIQYQVVEHLFCFYFFFELLVRFLAFRRKRSACTDGWFMFDFLLVTMGVAEVWVMSIVLILTKSEDASLGNSSSLRLIRLLRLSRLARTARLLRAAPELLIMVKGMIAAARSMLTTGVLIFAVLYVFGIAMKQAAEDTQEAQVYFNSVLDSMFMLLLHATLLDSPGEVIQTLSGNYVASVIFVVVIALSALLLLNMLIGVMCEVVSGVSQTEREVIAEAFVRDKVQQIMEERGLSGRITQHELLGILNDRRSTRLLSEAHVDVMGLVDIADYMFQSDLNGQEFDRELSFDEFLRVIMSLRGSNTVTLKDIMDLRRTLHANQTEIRNVVSNLEEPCTVPFTAGTSVVAVQDRRCCALWHLF
ncbi:Scn10a [Symbiodinium sp. CCMP2592]|nr:Scn10a [Symbiodinium sp. CCMP2592]